MLCPINSWCRSNHRSNCFTPLHFTALINTETGDARTALTTFRFCCRLGRANPLRDWWLPAAAAIGNRVTPLRQRTPGHLAPSDPKRFARSRVSAMGMRGVTSGIVRLVGLQEWRLQCRRQCVMFQSTDASPPVRGYDLIPSWWRPDFDEGRKFSVFKRAKQSSCVRVVAGHCMSCKTIRPRTLKMSERRLNTRRDYDEFV